MLAGRSPSAFADSERQVGFSSANETLTRCAFVGINPTDDE